MPDAYFEDIPFPVEVTDGGTEYFQDVESIKVVEAHFPRAFFDPSLLTLTRLHERYGNIVNSDTHYTAVHVRRTDYLRHPESFPPVPRSYYTTALATIRVTHPDTTLLIFSDDIRWCRANMARLGLGGPATFCTGRPTPIPLHLRSRDPDDITDLFLMARCQSHILSNSTFAWWGAYLSANPEPIYPWPWFGPKVIPSGFPDHWLRIDYT